MLHYLNTSKKNSRLFRCEGYVLSFQFERSFVQSMFLRRQKYTQTWWLVCFQENMGKRRNNKLQKLLKASSCAPTWKDIFSLQNPINLLTWEKLWIAEKIAKKVVQVIKKLPKTIKWTNFPTNYQRKHKVSTIQYLWQKLHYILQRFNARNTNFTQPLGAVLLILYQNITIKQVNKFFLKSFRNNHILYVLMNKIFDNPK